MAIIRLRHNDFPEELERQIMEKLGKTTVNIVILTDDVVVLEFDELEEPWKHPGAIGRAVEDLMEGNEWIRWEEPVGSY